MRLTITLAGADEGTSAHKHTAILLKYIAILFYEEEIAHCITDV